jgi:transcriptional regulator with XRE-family HTH domain
LGWSQNELARRAGVNHPTLFKIEAGQRADPSISIVVRIARALGTTAETLLGVQSGSVRIVADDVETPFALDVLLPGGGVEATERARARVTAALEAAGITLRDAAAAPWGEGPEAGALAAGGLALVEELQTVRRRLDALEAWRRSEEAPARKRATP